MKKPKLKIHQYLGGGGSLWNKIQLSLLLQTCHCYNQCAKVWKAEHKSPLHKKEMRILLTKLICMFSSYRSYLVSLQYAAVLDLFLCTVLLSLSFAANDS